MEARAGQRHIVVVVLVLVAVVTERLAKNRADDRKTPMLTRCVYTATINQPNVPRGTGSIWGAKGREGGPDQPGNGEKNG